MAHLDQEYLESRYINFLLGKLFGIKYICVIHEQFREVQKCFVLDFFIRRLMHYIIQEIHPITLIVLQNIFQNLLIKNKSLLVYILDFLYKTFWHLVKFFPVFSITFENTLTKHKGFKGNPGLELVHVLFEYLASKHVSGFEVHLFIVIFIENLHR